MFIKCILIKIKIDINNDELLKTIYIYIYKVDHCWQAQQRGVQILDNIYVGKKMFQIFNLHVPFIY